MKAVRIVFLVSFCLIYLSSNAQLTAAWNNSQDGIEWINENLSQVRQDKSSYYQTFKLDQSKDDFTTINMKVVDAKGSETTRVYEFYLGHLDAEKTRFEIKGTAINIKVETSDNEKVVKVSKNGVFQEYKNSFDIKSDDPQLAKDLVQAFNFAITSSNYKALAFANSNDAIKWLSKEITDGKLSKGEIQQSFEYFEDQRKKMILKTSESNSKSNLDWEYSFYANDFNDLLGKVNVIGEVFKISFTTIENKKMVKIFKNGDQQKFNKHFEVSAIDAKKALDILQAFKVVFAKTEVTDNKSVVKENKSVVKETAPVEKSIKKSKTRPIGNETVPKPEFISRPYYLENSNLEGLERVSATLDMKNRVYAGSDFYYTAFGEKSNVRFEIESLPPIIIMIEGSEDPEEMFQLIKSEGPKRDRRRFKISSRKMMGKSRDVSDNQIDFEMKKIRNGVYQIVIENIGTGEYAILPNDSGDVSILTSGGKKQKISCFGID